MKAFYSLFLVVSLLATVSAQRDASRLINTIKKHDKSVTVKVPGWLIERAVKLGMGRDYDQDLEVWRSMSESINQIRVSVVEDDDGTVDRDKISSYLQRLKEKDNFETYAKVKDGDTTVDVMVRQVGNKVRNVLLYLHSEDAVSAVYVKSDIDLAVFEKAQFRWKELQKKDS